MATILDGATRMADLGRAFGAGLKARELDHLVTREWAATAEDVLWRRTKLGLHMNESERRELDAVLGAC
ncbi:MAG: hypothetical protein FJX36_16885 [Alphaproteobacteria bacterium]|nr:hypothetical protein [Alphaproteobacteria bacterium]